MNSLERVLAAVTGGPSDRRAVALMLSLYGSKLTGCPLFDFYNNSDNYAEGQLAVKERFGVDVLFTPFVLTSIAEAFGSEIKYYSSSPPNMVKPAAPSYEMFSKIDMAAVEDHPRINYLLESARKLAAARASDTAIAAIFLSPMDLPPLLMGIEAWLETILFNEAEAEKIITAMSCFFVKTVNSFFSSGVHFVALPAAFCNPMIVTARIIDQIALPYMKAAFAEVKGPIIFHHVGAPMNEFIESLIQLPNVIGFAVDQSDDLSVSRNIMGSQKVLLGNIDGPTLNKKTPERIRRFCENILENRKADSRFVMASSGADISLSTPEENIDAIIETVKRREA
jgi:uroporphyrinogen decarboxylase